MERFIPNNKIICPGCRNSIILNKKEVRTRYYKCPKCKIQNLIPENEFRYVEQKNTKTKEDRKKRLLGYLSGFVFILGVLFTIITDNNLWLILCSILSSYFGVKAYKSKGAWGGTDKFFGDDNDINEHFEENTRFNSQTLWQNIKDNFFR